VAEVVAGGPGGDDQRVERNSVPVGQDDLTADRVKVGDLAE